MEEAEDVRRGSVSGTGSKLYWSSRHVGPGSSNGDSVVDEAVRSLQRYLVRVVHVGFV
jgi:hypothetical protein